MYACPLILTSFKPFVCTYVPNVSISTQVNPQKQETENIQNLSNAVQKFTQLIQLPKQGLKLDFNIDYMNLNQRYFQIELPKFGDFAKYYLSITKKYQNTYNHNKTKHSWGKHDILILLWSINLIKNKKQNHPLYFSKQQWQQVANIVPFRSGQDCMYKWLSIRKNKLQEYPWSDEQKKQLTYIVESSSVTNWIDISKRLFKKLPSKYRTAKQCKQCWSIISTLSFERANKFWSVQQDRILLQSFNQFGRKWKTITSILKGRSQNAIKNRFNLINQKHSKNIQRYQNKQLKQDFQKVQCTKQANSI